MRKILCLFVSMLFLGMSACGECQHEWKEATCTSPKTCEKCGATDGVALSHKWGEASCDEYPVCTVCGTKSGTAVEHQWDKKYDSGAVKYDAKCEKCGMKYETYQEKELERTMSASTARSIAMKKAKSELEQKYSSSSHVINIRDADDGVLSGDHYTFRVYYTGFYYKGSKSISFGDYASTLVSVYAKDKGRY